jgi:cell division transport system ATP-binding protein
VVAPPLTRIARAIVSKPPLLVADEPTGNLDATLAAEVMELFRRFNEVGVTVVIATHDRRLVQAAGWREIMLEDGRVQLDSGASMGSTTVADVAALGRITTDGPDPESP